MEGFGGARETSPGPLERVVNPLLRPLYPSALHCIFGTQGISRFKQILRSHGWHRSLELRA